MDMMMWPEFVMNLIADVDDLGIRCGVNSGFAMGDFGIRHRWVWLSCGGVSERIRLVLAVWTRDPPWLSSRELQWSFRAWMSSGFSYRFTTSIYVLKKTPDSLTISHDVCFDCVLPWNQLLEFQFKLLVWCESKEDSHQDII